MHRGRVLRLTVTAAPAVPVSWGGGVARLWLAGLLAAALLFPALAARGQDGNVVARPTGDRHPVPFGVGERLDYDVKFGFLHVGSGRMEVLGTEVVRGREACRTRMLVSGGIRGYRVNDRLESGFDVRSLESLRFVQQ